MGPVEAFRTLEQLLHRNTFMVGHVEDAVKSKNVAAFLSNSTIIRGDLPGSLDRFDRNAPLTLHRQIGTRVPGSLTRQELYKQTRI